MRVKRGTPSFTARVKSICKFDVDRSEGNAMRPEDTKIERTFRVNSYDVDFAGIMSNQVYHRWSEDLRTDLIARYINLKELYEMGSIPVLAHAEIDFKKPLFLLDEVIGEMWVEEMYGIKWAVRGRYLKDGVVCAETMQWGVFIDRETKRPISAPEEFPKIKPEDP
ncbi:MAG: thioesterase family protein [Candidatus Thermoplasmatota archaeon]|nr:thioesterase family protein [Candidatus Thermoplasmatota archaeon]